MQEFETEGGQGPGEVGVAIRAVVSFHLNSCGSAEFQLSAEV